MRRTVTMSLLFAVETADVTGRSEPLYGMNTKHRETQGPERVQLRRGRGRRSRREQEEEEEEERGSDEGKRERV